MSSPLVEVQKRMLGHEWRIHESGVMLPIAEQVALTLGGIRFAHFCASYFVQTKGRWARKPLFLEPWQLLMFSEMLRTEPGNTFLIEPEDLLDPWALFEDVVERPDFDVVAGRRVYREGYIQMAEKSGKSTMVSALQLYFLGWDGEEGAEVYAAATTHDQAKIVFDQARASVKRSPELDAVLTVYKDAIYYPDTDSVFRVVSGDALHDEGLNPHALVIDELWAHKTRDLYDTMTSRLNSGVRLDPFGANITNAGVDIDTICGEVYLQAKAVLRGDPSARDDLFAFVPELEQDEIDDEAAWKRVNPSSWTTLTELRRAQRKQPAFVFRRRRLNFWTTAEEAWLPPYAWEKCAREFTIPEDAELYLGMDLGLKRDTAALAWAFPDYVSREIYVGVYVWGLHYDPDSPPPPAHEIYNDDRLSISVVEEFVRDLARQHDVREIAYDPYRFERSAQALAEEGFTVIEWPQTDQRMVPASERFYEDVLDTRIVHDGDPVLHAHVEAGEAMETGRGWRISKRKTTKPIDGLVAVLMAASRARAAIEEGSPTFEILS